LMVIHVYRLQIIESRCNDGQQFFFIRVAYLERCSYFCLRVFSL